MSEAQAGIRPKRRVSFIWVVPIVAAVLGAGMVVYSYLSRGPEITIVFSTAEGIEAGKTKIKLLSVDIGLVHTVELSDDHEHVVVHAQLDKTSTPLLHEDTQFWVVRPRIGTEGVSGLGTLLSGGYIQLAPGSGPAGRRDFVGLDDPPVTPAGTPGLRFSLVSDQAGSVSTGDPILYKDYRVGRIDDASFDVESQKMLYDAFIEAPYDSLVNSATRFWNASGISVSAGANGIEVDTASLESLLIGGVAMGLPEGVSPGDPVADGTTFKLFKNQASVNERPHRYSLEYVVRFPQSVRGLTPGAPVEYRGIRAGQVERILLEELASLELGGRGEPIPVLIRVEPGRLKLPDTEAGIEQLEASIEHSVANGMRASLATGSLITGSLFVALDIYPDQPRAEMGTFAGRPTIPTVATGLAGIEQKLTALLDKLNGLPLEGLLADVDQLVEDVNVIVASESTRDLPRSLNETMASLRATLDSFSQDSPLQQGLLQTVTELDHTLRSLQDFLDTLDQQPNALIFNRDAGDDPQPPAGTP